jgi:hypothetical protein
MPASLKGHMTIVEQNLFEIAHFIRNLENWDSIL